MRHNWVLISFLLPFFQADAQDKQAFTLKGDIKGLPDQQIYLQYANGTGQYKIDTAITRGGKFTFTGGVAQPVEARLYVDERKMRYPGGDETSFFMEAAPMQLKSATGKLQDAKLSGSKTQLEKEALKEMIAPLEKLVKPLGEAYDKLEEAYKPGKTEAELALLKGKMDKLKEQMDEHFETRLKIDRAFIHKYPNSYVSAQLLRNTLNYIPLKESEAYYARMSPEIQQSMDGMGVKKSLEELRLGSPGSVAHVFTRADIDGNMLNLSDFKGQYVLLDFWASWCGPCRKGNPHLKALYGRYKDKGFEVIGVSSDDSPDAWKKAVAQDGIGIWKHVLRDLNRDKAKKKLPDSDDLKARYSIRGLPTKILIDPQGMIIGRYGPGGEGDEAMDRKLKEIFGA